ncbi:MAG: CNNM domain-containing protein [Planctomycetota bacterium]|jgi:CBS domain containing-hemolysin-like protein
MTLADWLLFGGIVLLGLTLSALFSGLETGLYTINRVRLAVRDGHGDPAAMRVRAILGKPARMLATILIGNNIANYLSSFGIAALLDRAGFVPAEAIALNAALLIPTLFVFGEILPKDLFRSHTDHWTYACSWFLRGAELLLTWTGLVPVVQGFGAATARALGGNQSQNRSARQRMSRLIKEGAGAGVLSETQSSLADRAMVLRDRRVADEMVPWREVVTLSAKTEPKRVRALLRRRHYTRYPIVDREGRAVGIVSLLDTLLDPTVDLRELAAPAIELEPDTPVREALRTLRDQRAAMAVVARPSDRRPLGVVTLKDLVEPLTGELASW